MAKCIFGTPAYISPEQALDSSTVDSRVDVYSLGIILFEMLCGRRPYLADSPTDILEQLLDGSPIPDVRMVNSSVSPRVSAVISLMPRPQPDHDLHCRRSGSRRRDSGCHAALPLGQSCADLKCG